MTIDMKKLLEQLNSIDEAVTDSQMEKDAAINTLVDLIVDEAKNISCTRPDCRRQEFEGMVDYVLKAVLVNLKLRTEKRAAYDAEGGDYGDELKRRRQTRT